MCSGTHLTSSSFTVFDAPKSESPSGRSASSSCRTNKDSCRIARRSENNRTDDSSSVDRAEDRRPRPGRAAGGLATARGLRHAAPPDGSPHGQGGQARVRPGAATCWRPSGSPMWRARSVMPCGSARSASMPSGTWCCAGSSGGRRGSTSTSIPICRTPGSQRRPWLTHYLNADAKPTFCAGTRTRSGDGAETDRGTGCADLLRRSSASPKRLCCLRASKPSSPAPDPIPPSAA